MHITKKLIEDLVRDMILEEVTPKKAIEKEGGAIGLDMLADMTGMSKEELRDLIDKDPDLKKHRDGDIIDAAGLQEDLVITEEDIDEIFGISSNQQYHSKKETEKARMAAADKAAMERFKDKKKQSLKEEAIISAITAELLNEKKFMRKLAPYAMAAAMGTGAMAPDKAAASPGTMRPPSHALLDLPSIKKSSRLDIKAQLNKALKPMEAVANPKSGPRELKAAASAFSSFDKILQRAVSINKLSKKQYTQIISTIRQPGGEGYRGPELARRIETAKNLIDKAGL